VKTIFLPASKNVSLPFDRVQFHQEKIRKTILHEVSKKTSKNFTFIGRLKTAFVLHQKD
jgi:hypothetical protein